MVLSISPGPAPISEVEFFEKYAQMWRISDDFWDDWGLLKHQFDLMRDWASYAGKIRTWPDADMLPLGRLRISAKEGGGPARLTADEQQTLMTLWCIFRSPLIFGGDLPSNDAATNALITNAEVLEVDQRSSGNHQAFEEGNLRAWLADAPDGKDHYVAVFNLGEAPEKIDLPWNRLGLGISTAEVRDLWAKKSIGKHRTLQLVLPAHGSGLYRLSAIE